MGGRALRLEKSRVRSREHQETKYLNQGQQYSMYETARYGAPSMSGYNNPCSPSSTMTLSPEWTAMEGPPGFIPPPPTTAYIPTAILYPLMITGLPNDGSVSRRTIFLRFKAYGFIHGIDVSQVGGRITAVIFFDNPISYESALRSITVSVLLFTPL